MLLPKLDMRHSTLTESELAIAPDPPADQVTVASNTYVLDQVVEALRSGQIGGVPQQRIMLVGHSSGAFGSVVGVASQDMT
jgi:hypothetical protein